MFFKAQIYHIQGFHRLRLLLHLSGLEQAKNLSSFNHSLLLPFSLSLQLSFSHSLSIYVCLFLSILFHSSFQYISKSLGEISQTASLFTSALISFLHLLSFRLLTLLCNIYYSINELPDIQV